jgi:hypothetical protein
MSIFWIELVAFSPLLILIPAMFREALIYSEPV